jgi:XTP/dITP diphosphohydrolase
MRLIFATQNQHKLEEISRLLPEWIHLISLRDLHFNQTLPETHETLHENALEKARFVYNTFQENCFAEDTGLEVESLNGAPGVHSARYAGEQKNQDDNIRLLLKNLENVENRKARFRTVIALIYNNKEHLFEGTVDGTITTYPRGHMGFGYDPVFVPDGYTQTFAELDIIKKNKISHRAKAFLKMKNFLTQLLR